jgi:hypothetical protein
LDTIFKQNDLMFYYRKLKCFSKVDNNHIILIMFKHLSNISISEAKWKLPSIYVFHINSDSTCILISTNL